MVVLWILTIFDRSRSDFRKRPDPDPDPDLNKFSVKFLLEFFVWRKLALKSIFMIQKVRKHIDSLSIYGFYTHQKMIIQSHL
jgi:hypothetical protein